jgi:hypothetical protein
MRYPGNNYTWVKVKGEIEKECWAIYESRVYTTVLTYLIASVVWIIDLYFSLCPHGNFDLNDN